MVGARRLLVPERYVNHTAAPEGGVKHGACNSGKMMESAVKQQAFVEFERIFSDASAGQRYRLEGGEIASLLALAGIDTAFDTQVTVKLLRIGIFNTREFGLLVQAGMAKEELKIYGASKHDGEVSVSAPACSSISRKPSVGSVTRVRSLLNRSEFCRSSWDRSPSPSFAARKTGSSSCAASAELRAERPAWAAPGAGA